MAIALIDYGAGNLTSVRKALHTLGADVVTPVKPVFDDFSGAIVPGVGHFAATAALDQEWRLALLDFLERGGALLGICLGMQWLFEGSTEAPQLAGLGLIAGRCALLESDHAERIKVPHVGWNELEIARLSSLLHGVPDRSFMYFTHSFAAPVTTDTTAVTTHGQPFAAVVERGRVAGVQFHPEKSGAAGLTILRNFVRSCSPNG